jgi:integrase
MPRSLKEIVRDELIADAQDGKSLTDESIEQLMQKVYAHIEREALKVYKSNEPWALKSWAYSHILQDEVAKQAAATDDTLLDELIAPVKDWQAERFDPLLNFRRKLELSGKKDGYIRECMRVAVWLVTKYGKKQRYSEAELLEFLDWLDKRYEKRDPETGKKIPSSSYVTKVHQLKIFLDSLPEDEHGRRQRLPIDSLPSYPDKYNQPAFTNEEIESLIYAAVMDEKPESVLRLAIATIYGCRVGELAKISSENINLNHDNPTIDIPTEKKGRRVPQPIPKELIPLFSIPLKPKKAYRIQRDLKRICRKASVPLPHWAGIHSIRRSVVTALYSNTDLKEISIRRFMRWSLGGRDLGVMPRYVKTPAEVTDAEVLAKHPYLPMWKTMVQFLPYLPQYESCVQYITNYITNKGTILRLEAP